VYFFDGWPWASGAASTADKSAVVMVVVAALIVIKFSELGVEAPEMHGAYRGVAIASLLSTISYSFIGDRAFFIFNIGGNSNENQNRINIKVRDWFYFTNKKFLRVLH